MTCSTRIPERRIAGSRSSLKARCVRFFWKRCLSGFPWFWPANPPGQQAMVAARRLVRRHYGRDHHPIRRKLAQILAAVTWPAAALVNLRLMWHWLGPDEAILAGKRIPGTLWAALRHNILPSEYYLYGLWQPDRKINIDSYLYSNECARLFKILNRPSEPDPINDKLAFYTMCKVQAIPTPPVLAVFAPACRILEFEFGNPPQHDLFVKASTGGSRAERFQWHGFDYTSNRGDRFKPQELCSHLANRAQTENLTLLVQPVISNHQKLRVPSSGPLATARLVTGRAQDGIVIPIFSVIYFGPPDGITSHGNWVTLIDPANGQLMPSPPRHSPGVSMYRYRELGCRRLPDWDVALRHVKVAHQACSNFVFVGWDVAFTPHGPMLLEGNENWDAATYQTLRAKPLGHTKFAEILAAQLCGMPVGFS